MIQIQPITELSLSQIKTAIEKIAREAQSTQNTSGQTDQVYVTTVPNVNNIKEGQFVPYYDGTNYRIYTKLNGTLRSWNLT